MKRCFWVDEKSEIYVKYHDKEWGNPKFDDRDLLELLILEGFQAGLSWLTVLKKRQAFRLEYENFDVEKVANFDEKKIAKMLANKEIIRSEQKIRASILNAKIFMKIQKEFGSFSDYIWGFTGHKVVYNSDGKVIVSNELSNKISKDLKKRGMKYVGTVIVYSYLQAIGVVNDHDKECFLHKES